MKKKHLDNNFTKAPNELDDFIQHNDLSKNEIVILWRIFRYQNTDNGLRRTQKQLSEDTGISIRTIKRFNARWLHFLKTKKNITQEDKKRLCDLRDSLYQEIQQFVIEQCNTIRMNIEKYGKKWRKFTPSMVPPMTPLGATHDTFKVPPMAPSKVTPVSRVNKEEEDKEKRDKEKPLKETILCNNVQDTRHVTRHAFSSPSITNPISPTPSAPSMPADESAAYLSDEVVKGSLSDKEDPSL